VARIILITGGSRSGKSEYAQRLAEALVGRRVYVATCPPLDEEMRDRIRRHQQARARSDWHTIEETIDLVGALGDAANYDVVLVDCLTLWVNNLMFQAEQEHKEMTEETISSHTHELIAACHRFSSTTVFVTNEVGMGIVPGDPVSRRFRELAGRCNQVMAAAAHEVTLVVSGLPLHLKQGDRA
jgi:adenosylcobinamide kinase/adenosylcobinamide-phosphate guanylyltransferase